MPPNVASALEEPKLLDRLRNKIRLKHYSIRTEHAYVDWASRFIRFSGMRHPKDMRPEEVERFLTHLAVEGRVTASTQNQAKSALLFLYKEVLGSELAWLDKDVDFQRSEILIRDGKGAKDRVSVFPRALSEPLKAHLVLVRQGTSRAPCLRCCTIEATNFLALPSSRCLWPDPFFTSAESVRRGVGGSCLTNTICSH